MHTRIFVVSNNNVRTSDSAEWCSKRQVVGSRMDSMDYYLVATIRIPLAIGKERYIRLGR